MRPQLKRFYNDVATDGRDTMFVVLLDGREVKTPGKSTLMVSTQPLAEAVADEWKAQDENIDPKTMPFTQIACTAIDRISGHRSEIEELIANYIDTDLLSHRVDSPSDLARMQNDVWQPYLDWLLSRYDLSIAVTTSILPMSPDPMAHQRIRQILATFDDFELAVVSIMTQALGSVILALAVVEGGKEAKDAAMASQLDERYQNDRWGVDLEDAQRLEDLIADVSAASTFLTLHRP